MWTEIMKTGGILAFIGLIFGWQHSRLNMMDVKRKDELYQKNGQTNYVPRSECIALQKTFCDKIDEVKVLIIDLDKKREKAKDEYHKEQQRIGEKVAAIEAKLPRG